MKFHRTYHPDSWSVQARELGDRFYKWDDKTDALRGLLNSYRHPLIRRRALKRFGRLSRKNGIQHDVQKAFLPFDIYGNKIFFDFLGKYRYHIDENGKMKYHDKEI